MLRWIKDFFRLLYPNRCDTCGICLVGGERILCMHCMRQIPKTYFWQEKDNAVAQVFAERLPLEAACAYFHYAKGNRYRKLIHALKYYQRPDIGVFLGKKFGAELVSSSFFAADSVLVPVPLHIKRRRIRGGYNQSERIARGMSQMMGIPIVEKAVLRKKYNESQTKKKSRTERLLNVQNIFVVGKNIKQLQGKHVIIVDDVITTGATIEAVAQVLLKNVNCRISVAAAAMTK